VAYPFNPKRLLTSTPCTLREESLVRRSCYSEVSEFAARGFVKNFFGESLRR